MCQSPFQRNHLAITAAIGVARCPGLSCHIICLLHIGGDIAWRKTILHGKRIEERFDGRTHLATSVHTHVVVEVNEIHTSHVCLDMTVLGAHAHKSATQERLIVSDRVERSHRGIHLTVICEYAHRHWSAERARNLLVARSLLLEHTIALALIDGASENALHLLRRETAREGRSLLASQFLIERRLQEVDDMLADGILGILLHTGVDGGIYLKSVGINIIWRTVLLGVLIAPSIQRVGLPVD